MQAAQSEEAPAGLLACPLEGRGAAARIGKPRATAT